jgi:hypothetical protein
MLDRLHEWRSRFPVALAPVFEDPHCLEQLFSIDSYAVPTGKEGTYELKMVFKPGGFYEKLAATLRTGDEGVVGVEELDRIVHGFHAGGGNDIT